MNFLSKSTDQPLEEFIGAYTIMVFNDLIKSKTALLKNCS